MRNVSLLILVCFLVFAMVGCDLFAGEEDNEEKFLIPYHKINLQDIDDHEINNFSEHPNLDGFIDRENLEFYATFLGEFVENLMTSADYVFNHYAIMTDTRNISANINLTVTDDSFAVEHPDSVVWAYDLHHFDMIFQGDTQLSIADIYNEEFLNHPTSATLGLSLFLEQGKTSLGYHQALSLYDYLKVTLDTENERTLIDGRIDASYGSRLYSGYNDATYYGKILCEMNLKEFTNLDAEDLLVISNLIQTALSNRTYLSTSEWNTICDTIWGSHGQDDYLKISFVLADNDTELTRNTYTNVSAFNLLLDALWLLL